MQFRWIIVVVNSSAVSQYVDGEFLKWFISLMLDSFVSVSAAYMLNLVRSIVVIMVWSFEFESVIWNHSLSFWIESFEIIRPGLNISFYGQCVYPAQPAKRLIRFVFDLNRIEKRNFVVLSSFCSVFFSRNFNSYQVSHACLTKVMLFSFDQILREGYNFLAWEGYFRALRGIAFPSL